MATDRIRKGAKTHLYIKEWMENLGISDDEMAGRIGVASRTTVWKRYREQHRLDLGKIQEFADALGISRSQLNYPPGIQSLDAIAEKLTPAQREVAAEVIKVMVSKAS
jgi:transcriptional regulator with XRE-family HTH domain